MNFKLFKDVSSCIIKDAISSSLGFPTEKEKMDTQLKRYKAEEISELKRSMANRQPTISKINEKIRQYNVLSKGCNKFIEYYDKIFNKANEYIYNSEVIMILKDENGNELTRGSYNALKIYISNQKDPNYAMALTRKLNEMIEKYTYLIIDLAIKNNGRFTLNGKFVDCFDIYADYNLAYQLMSYGEIKDANNNSFYSNLVGVNMLLETYEFARQSKNNIDMILLKLNTILSKYNNENELDRRMLQQIDEIKEQVRLSNKYNVISASDEYLKHRK